jgi:uncharacterized protein (TIGR03083 family)
VHPPPSGWEDGDVDHTLAVDVIAAQSALAREALARVDGDQPVPSCPGWSAADLAWHLAEVQSFWASVVEGAVVDPDELVRPDRPPAAALLPFLAAAGERLVAVLRSAAPSARCWSWYADGWSAGWVARRQAHEALVHRADAELAAGDDVTEVEVAVAADGVAEVVEVMLDLPAWAAFEPDGTAVRLLLEDVGQAWTLAFGTVRGTDPDTGEDLDEDYAQVADPEEPLDVVATATGRAWDLDRWLWGRGPADRMVVEGDATALERLRTITTIE